MWEIALPNPPRIDATGNSAQPLLGVRGGAFTCLSLISSHLTSVHLNLCAVKRPSFFVFWLLAAMENSVASQCTQVRWHELRWGSMRKVWEGIGSVSVRPSRLAYTVKNIRILTDILWRVVHILTELVPCTFVSVNRQNNKASAYNAYGAYWNRLTRGSTDAASVYVAVWGMSADTDLLGNLGAKPQRSLEVQCLWRHVGQRSQNLGACNGVESLRL